jgi:hypothetical protein
MSERKYVSFHPTSGADLVRNFLEPLFEDGFEFVGTVAIPGQPTVIMEKKDKPGQQKKVGSNAKASS